MKIVMRQPIRGADMTIRPDIPNPVARPRKLTPEQIYEIRVRAQHGEAHQRVADEFEVSQSTITRAVSGETYQHVPHPVEAEWWSPGDPPGLRFLPYAIAARAWERGGPIEVMVEPSAPRMTVAGLWRFLDEWAEQDEADGTAQQRRDAIAMNIERMIQQMWAGTWEPRPGRLRAFG